jgi:D-alanine-D-alanine ligase
LKRRVAVLMGGMSAEREVSLATGEAIAGALRELGHDAVEIDVSRDLPLDLAREKPDAAFMALHGRGGEDGTVQGLLEIMRIPYTGCGVLASAVTMDKVVTKELLAHHGVPLAEDVVVRSPYDFQCVADQVASELAYPVMVKPASEGSSIGVVEVSGPDELRDAFVEAFARDGRVLVERFIKGRLLTVGIIGSGPRILPVLEIRMLDGFYDYQAKYQPGRSQYDVPARLDPEVALRAQEVSLQSFNALGCEGISRIDLMLEDDTGRLLVLEVNTIPGMTATSLIPMAAAADGMSFNEVVAEVLDGARLKIELTE